MDIRRAEKEDLKEVKQFYNMLINQMYDSEYVTAWEKDVYPNENLIASFIEEESMFIGEEDHRIISAMALNCSGNEMYERVHWKIDAAEGEALVIHILGVLLSEKKKGYGKEMLSFAFEYAHQMKMRAIRMDVHVTNITAMKLYEKAGYEPVENVKMVYEGIGEHEFVMYECPV